MAYSFIKRQSWSLQRQDDGHRIYTIRWLIKTGNDATGPAGVLASGLLPAIGTSWNYGGDFDVWAFCTPFLSLRKQRAQATEKGEFWIAEQRFSTIAFSRCQDTTIEDPLQEPQEISGSFSKYTKEWSIDKDGNPITNSAFQPIRGEPAERDFNRPTVVIGQNVTNLGLDVFSQMVDTVNDSTLWGLPARTIKLANVAWERRYWGVCNFYYHRQFEFEVRYETWDDQIPDHGSKALNGHWSWFALDWVLDDIDGSPPNKNDPGHFIEFEDRRGNPSTTYLDGEGKPVDAIANAGTVNIEHYGESNFLTLGIPTSL